MSDCTLKRYVKRTIPPQNTVVWYDTVLGQPVTDAGLIATLEQQLSDVTEGECCPPHVTTRTPICVENRDGTRSPFYLLDWSDGTTSVVAPVDGEDNWCECNC